MNTTEIIATVMDSVTLSRNEAGEATSINFETLKEVITGLQEIKKNLVEMAKSQAKAEKEEADALNDIAGREYAETLSEGDVVSWKNAAGKTITGVVGKQKEGAKTFHCIIDEKFLDEGKTKRDRYVKFSKLVVPTAEEAVA